MTDESWRELIALKRELLADRNRELRRAPEWEPEIRARYTAEVAEVDQAIAAQRQLAEAESYWLSRDADDPVASGIVREFLRARSDSEIFAVAQDIAGRFRQAAEPEPVPEPEIAFEPAYVDANNPMRQDHVKRPEVAPEPTTLMLREWDPDEIRRAANRTRSNSDQVAARDRAERRETRIGTATHAATQRHLTGLRTRKMEESQ